MEKEITGVYKMVVYSDGSVNLKRLEERLNDYESEGVSERIKQIADVTKFVEQMCSTYPDSNFLDVEKYTTAAIKTVAQAYSVTVQTVQDKCTRQAGLTKSEFALYLFELIKHKGKENFSLDTEPLYKAIVSRTNNKTDVQYLRKVLINNFA